MFLFTDSQLLVLENPAYMIRFPLNYLVELFFSMLLTAFPPRYRLEYSELLFEQIDECRHAIQNHKVNDDESLEHFASSSTTFPITIKLEHEYVGKDSALIRVGRG